MGKTAKTVVVIGSLFIVIALVLGMLGCGTDETPTATPKPTATSTGPTPTATPTAIEPIKLRIASIFPDGDDVLGSLGLNHFMDGLTEKTNGAVTFETYFGATLGTGPEHIDLVKSGAADIAMTHLWYTPDRAPVADLEMVFPFGVTDGEIIYRAKKLLYEEFPEFNQELANNNVRLLMLMGGNYYSIQTTRPVLDLDDFDGLKLAVVGKFFGNWIAPVGAVPVTNPAGGRYEMIQTGVVDGSILNIDIMPTFKLAEVAPYFIENFKLSAHAAYEVIMNQDTYENMSPQLRQIVDQQALETEEYYWTVIQPAFADTALELIKEQGGIFTTFPEEDLVTWAGLVDDVPAEWAAEVEAKGYPGYEIVKRWQEITTGLGWDWPREWGKQ